MTETSASRRTIFIAEDNPVLLQGLGRALDAHGYAVVTAEDGAAMLELLGNADALPDLLLLDVMMPGMSGFDVLRVVNADSRWSHLPVLLITAATDDSLHSLAMESGAVDVLIKPFRLADLLSRIETHLGDARRGRAAGDDNAVAKDAVAS